MRRGIVYFIDSFAFGGAERVLLQTLAGLDRQQWAPLVVHYDGQDVAALVAGIRALGVETVAMPWRQGPAAVRWMQGFADFLRRQRPAVFHAHQNEPLACKYALLAARRAEIPAVVATVHLAPPTGPDAVQAVQHRLVTRSVDAYLAVSEALARQLRARYGVPRQRLRVVHNGIDVARFAQASPATLQVRLRRGCSTLVLSVGRLERQKGHRYLLAALAQTPDVALAIAGDGPERAALEAEVRDLGIDHRVSFLGYRDDTPALLAAADVFALPSLFEGLPLTVLEAMAAGRPVVASAVGGVGEAVAHGQTGILTPPADAAALAAALAALVATPELAHRMGRAGHERVARRFSVDAMLSQTLAVYAEFLARPGCVND